MSQKIYYEVKIGKYIIFNIFTNDTPIAGPKFCLANLTLLKTPQPEPQNAAEFTLSAHSNNAVCVDELAGHLHVPTGLVDE